MTKVWSWFKANWKWFILPLWVVSIILVWLFTRGGVKDHTPVVSGTTDQAANTAVNTVVTAAEEKDKAIKEVLQVFEEKLKKASTEQLKEFETLKDKPASEIASWIDKF
jgi:hypothetical protein